MSEKLLYHNFGFKKKFFLNWLTLELYSSLMFYLDPNDMLNFTVGLGLVDVDVLVGLSRRADALDDIL